MTVPTVLRVLLPRRFWSITMQGEMFRIASTGGRVSCGSRRRAYVLNVSTSWRCASVQIVSKTSDDLPLPLTPVKATSRCFGTSTSMPLRLCVRAPRISMEVIEHLLPSPVHWSSHVSCRSAPSNTALTTRMPVRSRRNGLSVVGPGGGPAGRPKIAMVCAFLARFFSGAPPSSSGLLPPHLLHSRGLFGSAAA